MDFTLGGPNFCFLLGGVFLFVGIFMPLVRRANGIDPGLSNAPTVVYFFRKGWGFHGERIDVSYDCAQIGVLFFMVGASQVNYPHGYVWTTALVIYLWPFIAFVFVVVRLAGLRKRSPPDEAAGTFGDLYEKGTWELSRISRRWERQGDYVVRVNSVYADRTVPVSTILFKVFVPQIVALCMYLYFITNPWRYTRQARVFGVLGVLFTPVFLKLAAFTTEAVPTIHYMGFLAWLSFNHDFAEKHKVTVTEHRGENEKFVHTSASLKEFGEARFALRILVYCFIDYSCGVVLTLSLPIMLAQSSSTIEFLLNTVATVFLIQLDNLEEKAFKVTIRDWDTDHWDAVTNGAQVASEVP